MKRNIVIAAVTTVALIGGGTATALAVSGGDGGSARQTPATAADDRRDPSHGDGTDDDTVRVVSARVSAADAIGAALARTPGTAVSAELDDDDDRRGATVWDVDVLAADGTWRSVDVDARTGAVVGVHAEDEDDTAEVRRALAGTSVSAAGAARAASSQGATVTSVELDDDGADRGWEVETRTAAGAERDHRVDLDTGKVTARASDDAGVEGQDGDDSGHHADGDDHGHHSDDD
ncbi:peptidase propeptide and YpeB domain protein [Streptomyces griseoviridis]|uniref:Peptidase propeptide and YpeB domain protein n=1 Tax=Streptomyces griseoviridis TaxID=45398 RepID=A0A3S9ZBH4_STRGD|nr:PepSY domain-containing protein [Streptomyces griseoviridis]AZS85050.1 peptidase propeptide and YpeB domain protein [Streptomyces griseoviridis]QCN90787.1 peptidase propeptide and YpeB domain protein [Streptomyces griseoviridis]